MGVDELHPAVGALADGVEGLAEGEVSWLVGSVLGVLEMRLGISTEDGLTNHVERQPVPSMGDVHRLLATAAQLVELFHEEIDVLVYNDFLVAKGAGAEGVG